MKLLLNYLCLFLLFFSVDASAQLKKIHGDPHLVEKFKVEAAKNPEYATLKMQLGELVRTATPKNTNAAAVRNLLLRNSKMLRSIYAAAGIEPPVTREGTIKPAINNRSMMTLNPGIRSKLKLLNSLTKVVTAPYKTKEIQKESNVDAPDTSLSSMSTGKIGIVYSANSYQLTGADKFGFYANLFKHGATVPSDPTIVAAEIKLEYSFLYTGWDSYGAVRGLSMMTRTQGLPEAMQNNPMPAFEYQGGSTFPPYRIPYVIMPMDTVETEFEEFVFSASDTIVLQRQAIPGVNFTIELGLFFPYNTQKGVNGCYHYAEMILKKITIRYLKANEN